MMKKLLINIIAAAAMLVSLSLSAQDTRVQESRKAKLEKEIALIDKQLKENAAKSSNALSTLTLVRKKVADRKELVAESDREIAALTGRINAKQKDVDRVQARLDTLSLYYSKLVKSAYKNRDSKVWYMYILASENVGQAFRRAGYLRNLSAEMNRQGEKIIDTKSVQTRFGKNNAIIAVFLHFSDSCINVATDIDNIEILTKIQKLHFSAYTSCRNSRTLR